MRRLKVLGSSRIHDVQAGTAPVALPRTYTRWSEAISRLLSDPEFSYGAILALQLRVLWSIWHDKDLTNGDTAGYYTLAASWAHSLHDDIVWSPLYTDFLGTATAIFGDVHVALVVHRIVIVVAVTLLVLALMRALLHPVIAFFVATWWSVSRSNFNVDYEVHLFILLPVLVAALVVVKRRDRLGRGIALATLIGGTILVRNELVVAVAIFLVAVLIAELRGRRERPGARVYMRAYLIPLAIVAVLVAGFYERSWVQGQKAWADLSYKHRANFCQVYTFSYQQEYPGRYTRSAFTQCEPLMRREFGRSLPSIAQAAVANPGAVSRFLAWNAGLLPAGIEISLFGATSGGRDPGFFPVKEHRVYAAILGALLLAVIGLGLVEVTRDRQRWKHDWLSTRAWAVVVLGGAAATGLYAALTERPRPEYMYGLTVAILATFGLCVEAVLLRRGGARVAAPVVALVFLVMFVPNRYAPGPRPLLDAVNRLQSVRSRLDHPGSVLVTTENYGFSECAYLAETHTRFCSPRDWSTLARRVDAGKGIESVLDDAHATVIYASAALEADQRLAPLLSKPKAMGWQYVSSGTGTDGPWGVLIRMRSVGQSSR